MQLSKDDMETLAFHKFNKNHGKRYFGILIGWLIVFVIVILATRAPVDEGSWPIALAIVVPVCAGMLGTMYLLYTRPQRKYVKAFLDECEANPTLTYVSESTKETVNEKATRIHLN